MSIVTGGVIPAGSGVVLLARILGNSGQPITRASLSSIAYTVTDLTSATVDGTGTFTISSVVFDTLQQQDKRWRLDSAAEPGQDGRWGYNFLATLPASLFTTTTVSATEVLTPTVKLQCDVLFTPASGQAFTGVFRWLGQKTWSA